VMPHYVCRQFVYTYNLEVGLSAKPRSLLNRNDTSKQVICSCYFIGIREPFCKINTNLTMAFLSA
jgi:hypothetical protein